MRKKKTKQLRFIKAKKEKTAFEYNRPGRTSETKCFCDISNLIKIRLHATPNFSQKNEGTGLVYVLSHLYNTYS